MGRGRFPKSTAGTVGEGGGRLRTKPPLKMRLTVKRIFRAASQPLIRWWNFHDKPQPNTHVR